MIVVIIILLLILSSVVGGIVYWKRDELFGETGTGGGETSGDSGTGAGSGSGTNGDSGTGGLGGDGAQPPEPKEAGESCSVDADCQAHLVCNADSMQCAPMPVDCQGEYEPESCSATCGQPETVKTKKFIVSVEPENGGTSCPPAAMDYTCPETDPCDVSQCVGKYEDVVCPTDRPCDSSEMKIQRQFIVEKPGANCPQEGTSVDYICPATAPCYTGSMNRPVAMRASQKFKGQNRRARIFKYKSGVPYCLMIGGGDGTFSPGDSVELRRCDTHSSNHNRSKRLSSWRIKNDGRIETYETTDKYKKNNVKQPLCLDYNNNEYKVTKCNPDATGNDLLNRTFTLNDHDQMTWSYHDNQLTKSVEYNKWAGIAPLRIVPGRTEQCMDDASNDKVDRCDKDQTAYYMTEYNSEKLPNW